MIAFIGSGRRRLESVADADADAASDAAVDAPLDAGADASVGERIDRVACARLHLQLAKCLVDVDLHRLVEAAGDELREGDTSATITTWISTNGIAPR